MGIVNAQVSFFGSLRFAKLSASGTCDQAFPSTGGFDWVGRLSLSRVRCDGQHVNVVEVENCGGGGSGCRQGWRDRCSGNPARVDGGWVVGVEAADNVLARKSCVVGAVQRRV